MLLAEKISTNLSIHKTEHNSYISTAIAIAIISVWFISLIILFRLDLANFPLVCIPLLIGLRTFIHTGIFIIIHDSIHGVIHENKRINNFIGYLTAFLYALLPYKTLTKNHHQHHRYPATENDPDFFARNPYNPFLWYASFMKDYQEGKQFWILFWGMTVIFWSFFLMHIPIVNMFLFWVLPIILSSIQLFIFGIYLPHRPLAGGYRDRHRARSNNHSVLLSFITCYHFGYHWEHHQYPHLPWYKLPQARKNAKVS